MQTPSPPVLTVDDAVALAMGNGRVQSSALNVSRAGENTAGVKTERLPGFRVCLLGGEGINSISFTIPQGDLGTYPVML